MDWYSLIIEDESKDNVEPKEVYHWPEKPTEQSQQDEQGQEETQPSITTFMKSSLLQQAELTDTTEEVMERLEQITLILQHKLKLVDEHGHLAPEAEQHIMPLLFRFLQRREEAGMDLTLIIALCHNSSWRIMRRAFHCTNSWNGHQSHGKQICKDTGQREARAIKTDIKGTSKKN